MLTSGQSGGQGLCLLSLDGGGVRGLSSLYILKDLMESVNKKANNEPPIKPCEYFDMICGTSTGGIIAIMLGRLRMDVQECIDIYLELADKVFSKVHLLPVNLKGRTHGRYNSDALKEAIVNLLVSKQMSPDALLKDEGPYSTKVFVCSKRLNTDSLVVFTSYETRRGDSDLYENATIVQACLATSAAPTYFEPLGITLGPPTARYTPQFIDGGLGYNNPVAQLWTQAAHIFNGSLEEKVQCLISIGTGEPSIPDYDTGALDLFKRLRKIASDSRDTAENFYEAHRYDLGRSKYFRFNVEQGLENVDLGEAQQKSRIIELTKIYLGRGEVFDKMEDCTAQMATREWSTLFIQCLQDLADRYETEVERLTSTVERESAEQNLAWLVNTRLFAAWMTPARGTVICSRWLRYPRTASRDFAASFIAYFQSIKHDVLYLDCALYETLLRPLKSKLLQHCRKTQEVIKLLFLALICQGYGSAKLQDESVVTFILRTLVKNPNVSDEEYLGRLRECLYSPLDVNLPRNVVVLLHNVDKLSSSDIELLRNQFQDVMDNKRKDGVAQTRAFVTGNTSYDVEVALKGAMPVDESTEYQECLVSLRFKTMNLRRSRITSVNLPGDHWLWSHKAYCRWIQDSSGVLWINGKAGSGKSVIAKSIQRKYLGTHDQRDRDSSMPILCDWFYSARDGLTSHQLMLRSIVLQILEEEPLLFGSIVHHYRGLTNGDKMVEWNCAILEKCIFEFAVTGKTPRTIFCIVDGMDESEEDASDDSELSRSSAISLLERLTITFKIIILSRYHPSIEKRLRQSWKIILEDENLPDVEKAIDQGLASLFNVINPDGSMEQSNFSLRGAGSPLSVYQHRVTVARERMYTDFRQHFLENAGGVILWVMTVMSALKNWIVVHPTYKPKQLWVELKRLPPDMDDLYASMVQSLSRASVESVQLARRALLWVNVATASRPFQLQELREALQIPESSEDIEEDEYPFAELTRVNSAPSFYRYISEICGPFLELVRVKDPTTDDDDHYNSYTNIRWRDQIQLIHQTAKAFLESSEAAGMFQMDFKGAHALIREESSRYLLFALPKKPCFYSPLPTSERIPWPTLARQILTYLEDKALFNFILSMFPELKEAIPDHYKYIFEETAQLEYATPTGSFFSTTSNGTRKWASSDLGRLIPKIIESYFRTASEAGWNTAVENLLVLTPLRFGAAQWKCYWEEVPILHGALMIAIRYRLLPQVQKIAWHIEQRGLDILDLPDEVRFNFDLSPLPVIVQEMLKAGDFDIAAMVHGYRDAPEKTRLLAALETSRTDLSKQQALEPSPDVIKAAREAIETVIGFWKRPSKYDRSERVQGLFESALSASSRHNDFNFGPNIGYDLGSDVYGLDAGGFGANLNGETEAYLQGQKLTLVAKLKAQEMQAADAGGSETQYDDLLLRSQKDSTYNTRTNHFPVRLRRSKRDWESYRDLCRDVAILHGARNKNTVRLAPVDTEGHERDIDPANVVSL